MPVTKTPNPEALEHPADYRRPRHYWFFNDPLFSVHVLFWTSPCRHRGCHMCGLPNMAPHDVLYSDLLAQIDSFCENVLARPDVPDLDTLAIGNNGSILDPVTFPTSALFYLLARVRLHRPTIRRFTLITRPEYATLPVFAATSDERRPIAGVLLAVGSEFQSWPSPPDGSREIELAVGLETMNESARRVMNKRFGQDEITGLASHLALLNMGSRPALEYSLRAYFLLKPYPLDEAESLEDVRCGVRYLERMAAAHDIKITMHLNPVYVAEGTPLVSAFETRRYTPPSPELIARAVMAFRAEKPRVVRLCLGLSDEGLAVPGGSFVPNVASPLWDALTSFNELSRGGIDLACERILASIG